MKTKSITLPICSCRHPKRNSICGQSLEKLFFLTVGAWHFDTVSLFSLGILQSFSRITYLWCHYFLDHSNLSMLLPNRLKSLKCFHNTSLKNYSLAFYCLLLHHLRITPIQYLWPSCTSYVTCPN